MRTALISIVLGAVGLGLILFVATTAGPPDGYGTFSARGVHVYVPDAMRTLVAGERDVLLEARTGAGEGLLVASVPRRGRSFDAYLRFVRDGIRGGRTAGTIIGDHGADVRGADEARRLLVDYPDEDLRSTRIIARRGDRLYDVSVSVHPTTPAARVDVDVIVDSLWLG